MIRIHYNIFNINLEEFSAISLSCNFAMDNSSVFPTNCLIILHMVTAFIIELGFVYHNEELEISDIEVEQDLLPKDN